MTGVAWPPADRPGIVAAIMAIGRAIVAQEEPQSVYQIVLGVISSLVQRQPALD